jgi:hypothetical protein
MQKREQGLKNAEKNIALKNGKKNLVPKIAEKIFWPQKKLKKFFLLPVLLKKIFLPAKILKKKSCPNKYNTSPPLKVQWSVPKVFVIDRICKTPDSGTPV